MVLLGETPQEFGRNVRERSQRVYNLLLKAARPVLHYGNEEEVTGFDEFDVCSVTSPQTQTQNHLTVSYPI